MNEKFLNHRLNNLKPSGIRKFFDIANQMEDVISLGVGEPDFLTPWHIRDEAIYALEKGRTTYTANAGILELRQAISKFLRNQYNQNYDAGNQILVTIGASEAIDLALRAVIEPGDEVIIPEPTYVSYEPMAILAGAEVVSVPTFEHNQFRLTAQDLEKAITPKTKMIILCYPNNPTGAIMGEEDLREIAELVQRHNILVLSDEIYSELTYGVTHRSIANIEGMYERTLVINGFAKSFAMTGWRLGYAAGPEFLIGAMGKIHQYGIMCAPTVSQYAAIQALEGGLDSVASMRAEYDKRRRLLVYGFRKMGLSCFEPQGAFYVFPSIATLQMSSEEFCTRLLEEERVAVVPGTAFGQSGEGFIRCSYAYSLENLQEALKRMSHFVGKYS